MKHLSRLYAGVALAVATLLALPLCPEVHAGPDVPPPAAPLFEGTATRALAAMKAKAEAFGVRGTAIVAYAPGDTVTTWMSQMLVVGDLIRPPSANDKGANFLAIAYAKACEMASTLKDSGSNVRPVYAGEVGWQGGAFARGKSGFLFAAFSGGKSEEDYQISQAGLAVLSSSY